MLLDFQTIVAYDIFSDDNRAGLPEERDGITGMIQWVLNHRPFVLSFLFIAAQYCLWSPTAFSEVYQWTDENGRSFYSDSPPPGANNIKVKKLRIDRIERPEIKSPPEKASKDIPKKRDLRDITVILYLTDW